jgi:hypothetical protein
MALGHLGSDSTIAAATEQSAQARICNTFYQSAFEATLRDFKPSEARCYMTLSLIEEDPVDEWDYSYDYPNGVAIIHRILSGLRTDTRDSRVEYQVMTDEDGRALIYCDIEDAQIECTLIPDNLGIMPADFIIGLSLRLAAYIAPAITKGDPFKLGQRALALYSVEMRNALVNSRNQNQPGLEPDSDHIRSRS